MVSQHLVYGIKRVQDGAFLYVGRSSSYLSRPYSHMVKSSSKRLEDALVDCDRKVEIRVLEECDSKEDSAEAEVRWIHALYALGNPLVNREHLHYQSRIKRTKVTDLRDGRERTSIGQKVVELRNSLGYRQDEFAERVGVGIRFLKELELGKPTVRLDKVNQVLNYLGYEAGPVPLKKDSYSPDSSTNP